MASVSYREPSATVGKRMIVTGPDYIKEHLPKVHQPTSYIGEKRPALEKTGDLRYLWRPASDRSMPARYKHEYVGGVGWGVQEYNFINRSRLGSGFHIKYGEHSHAALDKITHRYQNPWGTCAPTPNHDWGPSIHASSAVRPSVPWFISLDFGAHLQPKPHILDMQGKYSRGFMAWHMGDYEETNQRNSKRAILVRQNKSPSPKACKPPKLPTLPNKEKV